MSNNILTQRNPDVWQSQSFSLNDFNKLTKPGLLFWVFLSALMGYLVSADSIQWRDTLFLFLTIYLTGSAAHIVNQFIERESDAKMQRTMDRPLVKERVTTGSAFFLAVGMLLLGYSLAFAALNPYVAFLSLLCFVLYVFVYTPLKQKTVLNTWFGALPGAVPVLLGASAAGQTVHTGALFFFGVLFFWQIPHFLSLAWKYKDDYTNAQLKMLCVNDQSGIVNAHMILIHSLALIAVCCIAPLLFPQIGLVYLIFTALIGVDLLYKNYVFYRDRSNAAAMSIFLNSLYFIPLLFVTFIVDLFFI